MTGSIRFTSDSQSNIQRSEDQHFWFRVRRFIIRKLIHRYTNQKDNISIIDLGCGSGGTLRYLEKKFPQATLFGVDACTTSVQTAGQTVERSTIIEGNLLRLSALNIEQKFDCMLLLDVLEHIETPEQVLKEAVHLLKPGGSIVITVPAMQSMWSVRDEALQHLMRYDRKDLLRLLHLSALRSEHMNALFFTLLIPVYIFRKCLAPLLGSPGETIERTEVIIIPVLNTLMSWLCTLEAWLSLRLPIPYGLSLYCVAQTSED